MRKYYDNSTLPGCESLNALHIALLAEGLTVPVFDAALIVADNADNSEATFVQLYYNNATVASYGAGFGVPKLIELKDCPDNPRDPLLVHEPSGRVMKRGDVIDVHNTGQRVLTGWHAPYTTGKSGYIYHAARMPKYGSSESECYASVIDAFFVVTS